LPDFRRVPVDKTGEIPPTAADYFVMVRFRQYRRWDIWRALQGGALARRHDKIFGRYGPD